MCQRQFQTLDRESQPRPPFACFACFAFLSSVSFLSFASLSSFSFFAASFAAIFFFLFFASFFFRFFSSYLPFCIRVRGIHARIDDVNVWHEQRILIDWSSLSLHFFIGLNFFLFPWLQQSKRQENCWCMTGGNFYLDCMPQHQHALRSCSIWDFASGMTKRTMICLKNFLRLEL